MKLKSKRLLSLSLTSLLCFSAVQPMNVNAATIRHEFDMTDPINNPNAPAPTKINGSYTHGIRFKLRARMNSLYKDWWQVNLKVIDGKLQLTGPTNIPKNLTFDDDFAIHVYSKYGRRKAVYQFDYRKPAAEELQRIMTTFNKLAPTYKDNYIVIAGKSWNDTLRFDSKTSPIIQTTNNNYTQGFKSIDRFKYAFKITDNGLQEVPFEWSWAKFN